ncbi:hypothetical protein HYS10_01525 [Candidatus Collierbacteria bacterium]|nr:hypothetical protein [Candidatus Collierbacteria bacterium]
MIENRNRATFDSLFPDGQVPASKNLEVIVRSLNPEKRWGDEVTFAQYLALAEMETVLHGSLEDIFRLLEIYERFYRLMGLYEVRDEEELLKKKEEIIGDKNPELFRDFTHGACEIRDRLVGVFEKYLLPEPKAMLSCLSWDLYPGGYVFTVSMITSSEAVKGRFSGDLCGYLQYFLEMAEVTRGYSYGVDTKLIVGLKARIASLS